jgi:hypothetical protein
MLRNIFDQNDFFCNIFQNQLKDIFQSRSHFQSKCFGNE